METLKYTWENSPIRSILTHADVVAKLHADGFHPPTIPPGCNTVSWYYQDPTGHQCLVVNQSGFGPEATDNEHEVNGCWMAICLDPDLDLIDARRKLHSFYLHLLKP